MTDAAPARLTLRHCLNEGDAVPAIDLLARLAPLSRRRLKDVMTRGGVWLVRGRGPRKRLRRATTVLRGGDCIELFYDAHIIDAQAEAGHCLVDQGGYSVWFKPPGLLAQGTDFGDHLSLLRQVEKQVEPRRGVWLIHRLDREAAGLMVFVHDRKVAGWLSQAFAGDGVEKRYRVRVRGQLPPDLLDAGVIETPLDGKPSKTAFTLEHYDSATDTSLLAVTLHSGRLHQIRRHFDAVGHPVMGDPRYGSGNADPGGLRLVAIGLAFTDPVTRAPVAYELDPDNARV